MKPINDLLEKLIQDQEKYDFQLKIEDKVFHLQNVEIKKSSTPVTQPTTRGGVYFSDTTAYKIKAYSTDLSLVPLFPKVMLGPNTDFKELQVTAISVEGGTTPITLRTHLTNTMQNSSKIELNMIIINIKN